MPGRQFAVSPQTNRDMSLNESDFPTFAPSEVGYKQDVDKAIDLGVS